MKNLLLSVLLLLGFAAGADEDPTTFARAGGKRSKLDDQYVYMVEIPKAVYAKINAGRELLGKPTKSQDEVNSVLWANQEYLSDWITLVRHQLTKEMNRVPTTEQVFVAWKIGIKEFGKIGYDVARLTDEALVVRLDLLRSILANQSTPTAPPLPTDGRQAVPRRYGQYIPPITN